MEKISRWKNVKLWLAKKKKWVIAGAILILLLVAIIGPGNSTVDATYTVGYRTITEQVEVAGKVESNDFAELGFEVGGKIDKVFVNIGDYVRRGQTLVKLDTGALYADLLDAEARVKIAQANLVNTDTSLEVIQQKQDALVASAYQNLLSSSLVAEPSSSTYTQTPPTLSGRYTGGEGYYKIIIHKGNSPTDYRMNIFGLESMIDVKIEKTTQTPIGSNGLFIGFPDDLSEYNDTTWYIYIPNIKSSTYTADYNTYQEALRERDRAIDAAEADLRGGADISIAEAELAQARALVARAQAEMRTHIITAPFDGTVSLLEATPGEITTAGKTIVAMVSDGEFEIELEVPEIDISKIEVGNPVDIKLDAFGKEEIWAGEIVAISQSETYVDGVPVYQTNVKFLEPDERIRSGLSSTVTIVTDTRDNVLAIPVEFTERDKDGIFTMVVVNAEDMISERRDLVIGLRGSDGFVEILDGLAAGEIITHQK